jgi:archaellum component FlaC
LESLSTEIRSFYSLRDLRESIEEEIDQYEAVADEYSQWLGSFIRDMEATHGNEEWVKSLSTFQKSLNAKGTRESKKEDKRDKTKKAGTSKEWISYKGIMLSASEQGEAEVLFDAIEEINRKIEQLNKVKSTIENLEKSTLGKDIIYIVYINNGVPEKIVLRHKRDKEFTEKFNFTADFSMLKKVHT